MPPDTFEPDDDPAFAKAMAEIREMQAALAREEEGIGRHWPPPPGVQWTLGMLGRVVHDIQKLNENAGLNGTTSLAWINSEINRLNIAMSQARGFGGLRTAMSSALGAWVNPEGFAELIRRLARVKGWAFDLVEQLTLEEAAVALGLPPAIAIAEKPKPKPAIVRSKYARLEREARVAKIVEAARVAGDLTMTAAAVAAETGIEMRTLMGYRPWKDYVAWRLGEGLARFGGSSPGMPDEKFVDAVYRESLGGNTKELRRYGGLRPDEQKKERDAFWEKHGRQSGG